jgi:hypothetical protein
MFRRNQQVIAPKRSFPNQSAKPGSLASQETRTFDDVSNKTTQGASKDWG